MRMMVFDHRACRWRPWHGTRAAWLKLPHAVAVSVCTLSTAALLSLATLQHAVSVPSPAVPVASPASANSVPVAAFLPSNPVVATAAPVFGGVGALPTPTPALTWDGGNPPSRSPSADPDGSLLLLQVPVLPNAPASPNIPVITDPGVVPTTQVPEPSTVTLLAGAVLLLSAARRTGLPRAVRHET